MLNFNKMTQKVQEAIEGALKIARSNLNQEVDIEHLTLFIRALDSIVIDIFEKLMSIYRYLSEIESIISAKPQIEGRGIQSVFHPNCY